MNRCTETVEGTFTPKQMAELLAASVADGNMTPEEADDGCRAMCREALMVLVDHDTLRACDLGKADALGHLGAGLRNKVLATMQRFNDFGLALGRELRRRGLVGGGAELN